MRPQRIELFREQAHVIAAREQTGKELARFGIAALQYIIVDEPKAARQESRHFALCSIADAADLRS
jgi:hypothetical protein